MFLQHSHSCACVNINEENHAQGDREMKEKRIKFDQIKAETISVQVHAVSFFFFFWALMLCSDSNWQASMLLNSWILDPHQLRCRCSVAQPDLWPGVKKLFFPPDWWKDVNIFFASYFFLAVWMCCEGVDQKPLKHIHTHTLWIWKYACMQNNSYQSCLVHTPFQHR